MGRRSSSNTSSTNIIIPSIIFPWASISILSIIPSSARSGEQVLNGKLT